MIKLGCNAMLRVAEDLPEQHRKQAVHITLDGDAMRFADLK